MKRKKSIKERLREWDADAFDLTERTAGPMHPAPAAPEEEKPEELPAPERETRLGSRALRILYSVLAALFGTVMLSFLLATASELPPYGAAENPVHNAVSERYIRDGMRETGAVNIVAGVILDYRAFDTLGESHVLFTALTAVLILLLGEGVHRESTGQIRMQQDRIVTNTASVLTPIIILFGVYGILTGHLGPGGGFSGGSIVGAGLILHSVAFGYDRLGRYLNIKTFRIVCFAALAFYSLSKCYSFFCGANGLHTVFSPGVPGRILSAGLILPLNIAVGVVVACTMYGLFSVFQRGKI